MAQGALGEGGPVYVGQHLWTVLSPLITAVRSLFITV